MLQEEPAWKSLYTAAIFETDKLKLQERVLSARQALVRHLRTLPYAPERRGERERIEYALTMLDLLLRAQQSPSADTTRRISKRVPELSTPPSSGLPPLLLDDPDGLPHVQSQR